MIYHKHPIRSLLTIHFCLWEIPCNYFPLYFSKERAYTSEGYRMLAFLSIDVKRDLIGCLQFSGALLHLVACLFMVLLIFNEQRVPKYTYFRFSTYLLRKPLLIRSTAFICNINHDWMIYRKHPIRSLLTSMLRKASIRYPSDVYALSNTPKDKNIGQFGWISIMCRAPDKLCICVFYAIKCVN
jgi:hypothetical protein